MTKYKVFKYGIEVFGSKTTFKKWLNHPNKALNNQIPINSNLQEVYDILGRIEYGIY
jgi:uncharacterized protein (DUF2384 family)